MPVPSVRLCNLRDGFEDAELLHMLKLDQAREIVQPLVLITPQGLITPQVSVGNGNDRDACISVVLTLVHTHTHTQ